MKYRVGHFALFLLGFVVVDLLPEGFCTFFGDGLFTTLFFLMKALGSLLIQGHVKG